MDTHVTFRSGGKGVVFEIVHNNGVTTLSQNLEITVTSNNKWIANMKFDGFPECDTPHDAAQLFSVWMGRMAEAIANHRNFNKVDLLDQVYVQALQEEWRNCPKCGGHYFGQRVDCCLKCKEVG